MEKQTKVLKKIVLWFIGIIVLFIATVVVNLIIFEKNASLVSIGEPIQSFNENNSALLVIDIQEATTGVISDNLFYKENSNDLIYTINQISANSRKQNIPIIYVRSEITNPLINILNDSYAKGSEGAKFDKRLIIESELEVIKKRNDAFYKSNLDNILKSNKINEIYIVGLDAAHCINITVAAAQKRNYKVNLIEEAILSESVELKDSMIASFKDRGVKILKIDSLKILE